MIDHRHATISIIIPALNEAQHIAQTIVCAQAGVQSDNPAAIEIIVVDGGSTDGTVAVAQSSGAKIMAAGRGRALQMNMGAAAATGQILLFLHADTILPIGFDRLIRDALPQSEQHSPQITIAGAFDLKIDGSARGLRWVEWGVKWRSRWGQLPYGDQAIFLKTETFRQLGGFSLLPLMEDFELISRLKKLGTIQILSAAVITSDRRWQQKGILKTTILNQIIVMAYLLGVAPDRLAQWYRSQKYTAD